MMLNVPVRHGYKLEGHGLRTAWLGSVAVCTLYVYSLFPIPYLCYLEKRTVQVLSMSVSYTRTQPDCQTATGRRPRSAASFAKALWAQ